MTGMSSPSVYVGGKIGWTSVNSTNTQNAQVAKQTLANQGISVSSSSNVTSGQSVTPNPSAQTQTSTQTVQTQQAQPTQAQQPLTPTQTPIQQPLTPTTIINPTAYLQQTPQQITLYNG